MSDCGRFFQCPAFWIFSGCPGTPVFSQCPLFLYFMLFMDVRVHPKFSNVPFFLCFNFMLCARCPGTPGFSNVPFYIEYHNLLNVWNFKNFRVPTLLDITPGGRSWGWPPTPSLQSCIYIYIYKYIYIHIYIYTYRLGTTIGNAN